MGFLFYGTPFCHRAFETKLGHFGIVEKAATDSGYAGRDHKGFDSGSGKQPTGGKFCDSVGQGDPGKRGTAVEAGQPQIGDGSGNDHRLNGGVGKGHGIDPGYRFSIVCGGKDQRRVLAGAHAADVIGFSVGVQGKKQADAVFRFLFPADGADAVCKAVTRGGNLFFLHVPADGAGLLPQAGNNTGGRRNFCPIAVVVGAGRENFIFYSLADRAGMPPQTLKPARGRGDGFPRSKAVTGRDDGRFFGEAVGADADFFAVGGTAGGLGDDPVFKGVKAGLFAKGADPVFIVVLSCHGFADLGKAMDAYAHPFAIRGAGGGRDGFPVAKLMATGGDSFPFHRPAEGTGSCPFSFQGAIGGRIGDFPCPKDVVAGSGCRCFARLTGREKDEKKHQQKKQKTTLVFFHVACPSLDLRIVPIDFHRQ